MDRRRNYDYNNNRLYCFNDSVSMYCDYMYRSILLKKEDPQYILKYVEEHKKEKVCSLMVRRNGELLVTVNENEKLPLASMAKIVIAVEFAKQVAEGKIDRAELIPLRDLEKYYVPNTDGGAHPKWIEDIKERSVIKMKRYL